MDEFYDFNALKQSLEVYGGASCAKFAVKIGSDEYLIKFPANLKNKTFKNKAQNHLRWF